MMLTHRFVLQLTQKSLAVHEIVAPEHEESGSLVNVTKNQFLNNIALLFMKLQGEYLLPFKLSLKSLPM